MIKIYLKKGREESLKRYHPWVFSGAINNIDGKPTDGSLVDVYSFSGEYLGCGHYQEGSISVRILSFDRLAHNSDFWRIRIGEALKARLAFGLSDSLSTNAYRLVHGEGDSLPGLIIDYYNGVAVLQAHSAGMYLSREMIKDALIYVYGNKLISVYDKSSSTAPFKAGLDLSDGYLFGDIKNNRTISENGHLFSVDWESGQKTGFFLDQRENRLLVKRYSSNRRVLNLFCYTGGFSVYALSGGASLVDSIDSSQKAVDLLVQNLELNRAAGLLGKEVNHNVICEDAIEFVKFS